MDTTTEALKKQIAQKLAVIIFSIPEGEKVSQFQMDISKDVMKAKGMDRDIDSAFAV